MEHSPKYKKVKKYFDNGFWNRQMVHDAVVMGWITAAEYEEITGEPYAD